MATATPDDDSINTFISITGASPSVALQSLQAHAGDLNQAVNAYFSEGDRNSTRQASIVAPVDDAMDIDETIPVGTSTPPFPLLPSPGNANPFSLLDPRHSVLPPSVSHPREIPVEVKDGGGQSAQSGLAPTVEEVTRSENQVPETHGMVTMDDDEAIPYAQIAQRNLVADVSGGTYPSPSAPGIDDLPDYHNDIEEEMVRAAIEASKREAENALPDQLDDGQEDSRPASTAPYSHVEDPELAHVVSLSLKTAEQEKALRELEGSSEPEAHKSMEVGCTGKRALSNGRLDVGSSSVQGESDDGEEQPLVRRRSRRIASVSANSSKEVDEDEDTPPSSPREPDTMDQPPPSGSDFPEWGGISSEEHDEAVMLEAAMFGGVPETSGYRFPTAPHHFMPNGRNSALYQEQYFRPPSPGLVAQRLIREQQDDEYLASLQADREKAEARRLEEESAREASLEAERLKEEESRRKLEAEQEIERQLAAKEASLPPEPASDNENSITLLVRMPDGSRRGRRFLKSDKLQYLFDFIDVGRVIKPGTYKLVRPYPRRAFSDEESSLSLNEVGLTSKQEALFLELIKP